MDMGMYVDTDMYVYMDVYVYTGMNISDSSIPCLQKTREMRRDKPETQELHVTL